MALHATPQPAHVEDWGPAVRLIFQHLSPIERAGREAAALHHLGTGALDPQGLFVVREPGAVVGAVVCQSVPGATGLVWPPGVAPSHTDAADLLALHAVDWLRAGGARVVQALLSPEEEPLAGPLERAGLARITDLWYLRHESGTVLGGISAPARAQFHALGSVGLAAFGPALEQTYEGTLDCPEVNGVRTLDEVLAGHRAQGRFDPDHWWLVTSDSTAVGVVIVAEMPETGEWELAYMGVVPRARRQGFGRELLLHVLTEARAADAPAVTLSVDARNRPAWQLYSSAGFEPHDRRAVYLWIDRAERTGRSA